MKTMRVVVDIPVPDHATITDGEELATSVLSYADAVAGPQQFGSDFTSSTGTWHVHTQTDRYQCPHCDAVSKIKSN